MPRLQNVLSYCVDWERLDDMIDETPPASSVRDHEKVAALEDILPRRDVRIDFPRERYSE